MCPCSPNDVSIPIPEFPTAPAIPGFGIPFALKINPINSFPAGFPEDLLDILNKLQLLVPSGALRPQLSFNFGKDIFDGILKLFDQIMPFIMLYKFFLPILNLVLCIIEVICSLLNPEKLINALIKLFRDCIPQFLNLFPIFAIPLMLFSILALLISLIEYLVKKILDLVELFLNNIEILDKAISYADESAILDIAEKLGASICIFQNLFVLFEIFNSIILVFKDILAIGFNLPPCDDNAADGCCTSDVCPAIVKTEYTRFTGSFKYLNGVYNGDPAAAVPLNLLAIPIRLESWQLFDVQQETPQEFINIVDAYDIPTPPGLQFLAALGIPIKPVFFPTDANYTSTTPPAQAAYTFDLRLFYNPTDWGRVGAARYIRFKDCIMIAPPSKQYLQYNNTSITVPDGVAKLVGGLGYEDDGETLLTGFDADGITPNSDPATLNNFLHTANVTGINPALNSSDGYLFENVEYTFKPNLAVLLSKNLITAGCNPELALNKAFVNNAFTGDIAIKLQELNALPLPDVAGAQECLNAALSNLSNNINVQGVAEFQSVANLCLDKLKADTLSALNSIIGLSVDPCKSTFTAAPTPQFTTKPILISVDLKDRNGVSLGVNIPTDVADSLSKKIKAHVNFGTASNFSYDGYQLFLSNLTSDQAGSGQLMVSFDNNMFCTNNIPDDITIPPTRDLQQLDYTFIYAPPSSVYTPEGDPSDGKPRRDETDLLSNRGDL